MHRIMVIQKPLLNCPVGSEFHLVNGNYFHKTGPKQTDLQYGFTPEQVEKAGAEWFKPKEYKYPSKGERYWAVSSYGNVVENVYDESDHDKLRFEIGNYFVKREHALAAQKAVLVLLGGLGYQIEFGNTK